MLKLLNVDAAGERALRVVAYFDQLGGNRPDLDSVVRATALIADCAAGLQLRDRSLVIRYGTDGVPLEGPVAATEEAALLVDSSDVGSVWLERGGETRDLDEFIVERYALTAAAVVGRERPVEQDLAQGFADPALAQLLVNEKASETERSRAARLIGLPTGGYVQLIAIEPAPGETPEALTAQLRAKWQRPIHAAELSRHLVLLMVVTRDPVKWGIAEIAGRAAAGPVVDVIDASRSWAAAREGLRFAGAGASWPRVLDSSDLGVVRLLGHLDPTTVAAHPDIVEIERLASAPNGAESVAILDHYLHADSLRSAAREVNFHHSSLQTRIKRIGEALGMDLKQRSRSSSGARFTHPDPVRRSTRPTGSAAPAPLTIEACTAAAAEGGRPQRHRRGSRR
jgi:hypothetical protein